MLLFAAFALGLTLTGCSEAKSINPQPRQKRMVATADRYECPPCAAYACPEGYYPTYEPYMTMSLCSCPIFKECVQSNTKKEPIFLGPAVSLIKRRKRSDSLPGGIDLDFGGVPFGTFKPPAEPAEPVVDPCHIDYGFTCPAVAYIPPVCEPGYFVETRPHMFERDGHMCRDPCLGYDYACVEEDPCENETTDESWCPEQVIPECDPILQTLKSTPRVYITDSGLECPVPCGTIDYECIDNYNFEGLYRKKRSVSLTAVEMQPIVYDPCQEYASKNMFCTKEMQIAPECEPGYIVISKPRVFVLDGGQECKDPCGKVDYECIRDPCYQNYLVKCMMVVEAPPQCKEGYEVQQSPATYEVDGFVCPEPCRKYNYECVPVKNDNSEVIADKARMRQKRMSKPEVVGISNSDDPCYQSYMVMCPMMYVPPPTCPEGYDLLSSPRMYETDSGHLCPQPCSQPIYTCYNKKTDEYCDPIYSDGPSADVLM